MWRLKRKTHHKDSEERERLKKELFGFTRSVEHGFPSKPSALAYDPKLRLLAIGAKTGAVKVYGDLGVEFSGQHKNDVTVSQLFFLPEQGRLISICSDNSLHLWEINVHDGKSVLEEIKEFNMESNKLKTISACCLTENSEQLLMGTEGGNIHLLNSQTFQLMDHIIYQDVVMQNVPDDFKINPGAVESIAVHPTNPDKFLIGYNRGLIVLWDNKESNTDKTYNATQQLESLTWYRNGDQFMSAHADGSYLVWNTEDSSNPKEPALTPYGPFPCKAISKIQYKSSKVDPFIIFSGGMPRASYGDRHTVSVMQGTNHVVFDFTSRVIDFFTITRADEDQEGDRPEHDDAHSLVVLVEEELVVIDLDSTKWPTFRLPYLNSLHSSAITCSQHVTNVPEQLWQKISDAGEGQHTNYSQRSWPLNGGRNLNDDTRTRDLLLTGHEDGTVRFWDASTTCLKLLYKLTTANVFGGDIVQADQSLADGEEEWPPFRKVGTFDPYSDDPRLGVQKIALCPLSETLVIAGTAGQVIILQMEREEREQEVKGVTVTIVNDRENFVWKGHEALVPKEGDVKFAPGFQPTCIMQMAPPAACTSLAFHSEWQLVAAGNAHGFGIFDYVQKKEVLSRCTLNPSDLTGTSDTPISRRKSFKKSLRESFRRLRRRRSERRKAEQKTEVKSEDKPAEGATAAASPTETQTTPEHHRPVERQVEARSTDDTMASMVRYLYFADTFIVNQHNNNPTLWIGTNAGHIFVYTLTVPSGDKRSSEEVSSVLVKEIKLRHKAPVISMSVLDKRARVLPESLEVQHERAKAPDMSGDHQLVICSEEQFKVFSLPHLKPVCKVKLTAQDGSRVRKIAFVNFRSKSDENYSEYDVACLTNLGDISIYTLPQLRRQLTSAAIIRKDDITGISSFIFTKNGQCFSLASASEFSRLSLAIRYQTTPNCVLDLKEGMRPKPEPERQIPVVTVEATEEERPAAEGAETVEATPAYGANDIAEGLERSTLEDSQNESRADTTGDITQDSIRDVVAEREAEHRDLVTTETHVEREVTEVTTTITTTTIIEAQVNGNIDDDTKATTQSEDKLSEELEPSDKLSELKIEEPAQTPAVVVEAN